MTDRNAFQDGPRRLQGAPPTAVQLTPFLERMAALAGVVASDLATVTPFVRFARLQPGDFFTNFSDQHQLVGYLISGFTRAYYRGRDGREHNFSFLGEQDFLLAYGAAIRGEPANLAIEALEVSDVLFVDYAIWRKSIAGNTKLLGLALALAERNYALREQHFYELLTLSGQERYRQFVKHSAHLIGRIAQRHIASYLGMTPVSLSRLVAKDRRSG